MSTGWRNWWGVGMACIVVFGASYVSAVVYGSCCGTGPIPAWWIWWLLGSAVLMVAPIAIGLALDVFWRR